MAKTGRESVQQMLRLPDGMREWLRNEAEENGRSINAEIIQRLIFTKHAHPHALLIRALIELHETLLSEKDDLEVPPFLQEEVRRIADKRGVSAQKLLMLLLTEAINHLDEQTDLGKEFEKRVWELEGVEADISENDE